MDLVSQASATIKAEILRTRVRLQQLEAAYVSLNEIAGTAHGVELNGSATVEIEETPVAVGAKANDTETVVGIPVPMDGSGSVRKARKPRAASGLPSTGNDFWYGILGAGKKDMGQIVDEALKKLKIAGDAGARKAIAARASSWLYPALREGAVKSAGTVGGLKAYRRA